LSKLLSHQAILFQELSHLLTRCFKEDFSLIQILKDTDSDKTINKFQLTAHTELELPTTREMEPLLLTETKEELSTTNQTQEEDQRKIDPTPRPKELSPELLEDMHTLIQILLMSNQELSGIKFSPMLKDKLSSTTYLDLLVPSPTDQSKKVSLLTSSRSTQIMETDLLKLLMFQLTKLDYEII